MPTIRLLTDFAGDLEGHNCPHAGDVIDVSRRLATTLCAAELAELVDGRRKSGRSGVETAVSGPPENRAARTSSDEETA